MAADERRMNPPSASIASLRGDFARLVSAHAVGDRKQPNLLVGEECVFVSLPNAADVRNGTGADQRGSQGVARESRGGPDHWRRRSGQYTGRMGSSQYH